MKLTKKDKIKLGIVLGLIVLGIVLGLIYNVPETSDQLCLKSDTTPLEDYIPIINNYSKPIAVGYEKMFISPAEAVCRWENKKIR